MTDREANLSPSEIQAQWDLAKQLREKGHSIGTRIAAAKMLEQGQDIMRDMDAMNTLVNGGRND